MPLGEYAQRFTANLDTIVTREALTTDLNLNQDLVGEVNGVGEVKVPKMTMDGLANYDRQNGFAPGDITTAWETVKLAYDRGREFEVDAMDDDERAAVISANIMAEFARTQVIPEIDAIRFARLAAKAGNTQAANLTAAAATLDAVVSGEEALEDAGADLSQCILYCTSAVKGLLRKAQPYRLNQGENPNGRFVMFDDMKVVTVPSARFSTEITLNDGTTSGQTAGGFKASGTAINFMIVHPAAAAAIQKHLALRYFAPEVNQAKDAHKWQYRVFHDLFVFDNKAPLIYCHKAGA